MNAMTSLVLRSPCKHGDIEEHYLCDDTDWRIAHCDQVVDTGWYPLKTFGDGPGVYIEPGRYVVVPVREEPK